MERILEHMNSVSTKLVATGILPSATFYKNDLNITDKLKVFNKIFVYFISSVESTPHFNPRYGTV